MRRLFVVINNKQKQENKNMTGPALKGFHIPKEIKNETLYSKKYNYKSNDSQSRYNANRNSRGISTLNFKGYSINNYGIKEAKPLVNYFKETYPRINAKYLIGFELEIEGNTEESRQYRLSETLTKHLKDSHYCCTDGSLQNGGVEIVSAPRTFLELKQNYHNLYSLTKKLSKYGFQSHDTGRCGLHFHVTRKALDNSRWNKLQKFVVCAGNKNSFLKLSRRDSFESTYTYCNFASGQGDRYLAVNLTRSNTVEFRFFRGTLNPHSFIASLELIVGLVEFFKAPLKSHSWIKFNEFMRESTLKYGYLYLIQKCGEITPALRKQYTAEEKARRKLELAERKRQQLLVLQTEVSRHLERAHRRVGILGGYYTKPGSKLIKVSVPVIFEGFTKKLRDFANSQNLLTELAVFEDYPNKSELTLTIRRSGGWGRYSTNYNVNPYTATYAYSQN